MKISNERIAELENCIRNLLLVYYNLGFPWHDSECDQEVFVEHAAHILNALNVRCHLKQAVGLLYLTDLVPK